MQKNSLGRSAQVTQGYLSEDTIAALATGVGGAIAVIRVSGPRAFAALGQLLGTEDLARFAPRMLARAALPGIDDALAVRFVAPESFTGEDVVELHVHGGSFTSSLVLERLQALGVRQALPGEFSFRAVRNGKLTLSQAQAIPDLIAASNEDAVALALEKLSGTQNQLLVSIASQLRTLSVLGEVGIDFADQDVEELSLPALKARIAPVLEGLERLRASYERGTRIQEGFGAAFVGLPNAGKSSFFNLLLGENRSIVSEIAGTTRDVVKEQLRLKGSAGHVTLRLHDTAGLRGTADAIEQMGVERSVQAARAADLIFLVVDAATFEADFGQIQSRWENLGRPAGRTLGILNKVDLLSSASRESALKRAAALGVATWFAVSSLDGAGVAEAVDGIVAHCASRTQRGPGEVLLTRLDHFRAVESALGHLRRALAATEEDLFSADARQTLLALGPLVGDTLPDDILGRIFSDFCIGK
jgi:tRNA modification GTPase